MNSIISFKEIDISYDGTIRCAVIRDGEQADFYIRLPYSFTPAPDLIVATFVAIVGKSFEQIHIDLPMGPEQHKRLEEWTQSQIIAPVGADRRRKPAQRAALNFSGGFDSMAARVLVPEAELISLDFGGRFSRERVFFERFSPYIIETNLVDIGLNRYSLTFMGVGSLLMRDELALGSYSFGSIMADTASTLVHIPIDQRDAGLAPAQHFDMQLANPVAGLSEIAAMRLVALVYPELLSEILMSVALPREEKFVRKHQMLTAVMQDLGINLAVPTDMKKRPQGLQWGYSAATDLSSLYAMTILGVDTVMDSYPNGIPAPFVHFAENHSMEFMNRVNPHAYAGVPASLRANWYAVLISHGIFPFEREDWSIMSQIMSLFD